MPSPRNDENKQDFLNRCMGDAEARRDFPRDDQRYAFCNSKWTQHLEKVSPSPSAVHVPSTEWKDYEKAEYDGQEVKLDQPFRLPEGASKKFGVYVRDGDEVKRVTFGDPDMEIKRDDDEARENFRNRFSCDSVTDKTSATYWSCKMWQKGTSVSEILDKEDDVVTKQGRTLSRHDDKTSKVPFPHDQEALGKLRPDQTPRMLGALTHPDRLEPKEVPFDDLFAIQNRVDTDKVKSISEQEDDGPAGIVARFNNKNYILDGHHRIVGRWLRGDDSVEVRFINLNPLSNAMKRYVNDDTFTNRMEAEDRSFEVGLGGAVHTHQTADGQAVYMPGSSHEEYLRHMGMTIGSSQGGLLHALSQLRDLLMGSNTPRPVEPEKEPVMTSEDAHYDVAGTIFKVDEEQRIVYGWASVISENGEPVTDTQGDVIGPDELTKAVNDFMLEDRVGKVMHEGDRTGTIVHSFPITKEIASALGIQTDREGWVVGYHVADDEVWSRVKDGDFTGFSIGGEAQRIPINE